MSTRERESESHPPVGPARWPGTPLPMPERKPSSAPLPPHSRLSKPGEVTAFGHTFVVPASRHAEWNRVFAEYETAMDNDRDVDRAFGAYKALVDDLTGVR